MAIQLFTQIGIYSNSQKYSVTTDCLGGPLVIGERVLLAWLPRTKTGNGWNGTIVQGTVIEYNSPTHPFAIKDDNGKII